jgi:signal transduction histidine kinase
MVKDEGPGLSEAQLAHLFEPFNRLGAESTSIPGTGLGLVISKGFAEAMGGRLEVWSEMGSGSRFSLFLHAA